MKKSYEKYLPKKVETVTVSFPLDSEVHEAIKEFLEDNGYSWREFTTALYLKFLDESGKKRRAG